MRKVNLPPEAWAYCLSRSSAVRLPGMSARKKASAPAASRHSTTPHMPQRLRNVMSRLASPPLRLERAKREEEREGGHRKVVDEVLGVDDALGEPVHVLDD